MGLMCALIPAHAQSAAEWQAQQEAAGAKCDRIMAEATAHKGLLSQYMVMRQGYDSDHSQAFQLIFGQYISWYLSFLGDYPDAVQTFAIAQTAQPDDNPSPLAAGSGYTARPALDAIPELAKNYRIVLFNEAHNVAMTRSLTVQVLSRLREEGFDYFAAETLSNTDTGLQARGYPTDNSGFYTEEPIYAEMVRTALKLGFKVIAYEADPDARSTDERETEQARHLYQQVFEKDPNARLVVNAGYDHIVKSGVYLDGSSMAEHLHKLTHLPMLAVEQTMFYPRPSSHGDHPYYTEVMRAIHPDSPIVFVNAEGKPWALRDSYDVSVFFPPEKIVRDRPTWLSLGGLRLTHYVTADHCNGRYPCLIEARYDNEGPDAIPADRMELDMMPLSESASHIPVFTSNQQTPSGNLYLRPGKYQLSFSDKDGHVLHREDIAVAASSQ
jgi:tetratricopeptide (TPR) repeat protein